MPEALLSIMRRYRLTRMLVIAGLMGFLHPPGAWAASHEWYYTIGEVRSNQQGNFCLTRADVVELAGIFRKYGVRPGFAALSSSPNCRLSVDTFTPREVVEEVDVTTRSGKNEYTISFIRVEMAAGQDLFLVTTRNVHAAK